MPHVYRRPFDYAAPRSTWPIWHAVPLVEAATGSAAFTTYAATVTLSAGETQYSGRAIRFSRQGIFRDNWRFAQINARIILYYYDASQVNVGTATATFETFAATVQLAASSGATISAGTDALDFATYAATVTGNRLEEPGDANAYFTTYPATVTRTEGLGVSRTGDVGARSSGTYIPGTVRGGRRRQSGVSGPTKHLVRLK